MWIIFVGIMIVNNLLWLYFWLHTHYPWLDEDTGNLFQLYTWMHTRKLPIDEEETMVLPVVDRE